MFRTIPIQIAYESVAPDSFVLGTKGSSGIYALSLTFGPEWDAYIDRRITFRDALGEHPVSVFLTDSLLTDGAYLLTVPAETTAESGTATAVIDGENEEGHPITLTVDMLVLETEEPEGNEPSEKIDVILQLQEEARQSIESAGRLEQRAAAGEFSPYVGPNGNWWVNGADTGQPSRGDGAYQSWLSVGNTGTVQDFLDSISAPYIGPNGNWWLNGADTGQPARGPKGDRGSNFTILALYASVEELLSAHPVGKDGDAYWVGTSDDNVIYIWDVDAASWECIGSLYNTERLEKLLEIVPVDGGHL